MWESLGLPPPLRDGAIHVWCIRLDIGPEQVQQLVGILSPDERERAAAFRFPHLQRRYVVAHAALRQLLAHYLAAPPSSLRFRNGPFGKPSLACVPDAQTACFNLAHSEELALLAVARGYDIGVDVERVRDIEDVDEIAGQYFCPPERDVLQSSSGPSKMAHFFRYWTRKEALLKTTGDGLSLPLDRVDVSTVSGKQPQSVSVLDGAGVPRQLAVVDLRPEPGYMGALAADCADWRFDCWEWVV